MLKFVILVSCTAAFALAASPDLSKRQNPVFCEACKFVIQWIEGQLTANATEKEIEQFLENDVCALLPSPLSDTCKQIVEGDLSTLIEKLVKKEDPGTVCAELKACSQKVVRKVQDTIECELCKLLIQKIEDGLAKNATVDEIVKEAENVCALLPGSLADTCKSLVDQYLPELIQMLINKEDPATVCTQVGLCQTATKRQEPLPCDICELVFQQIEKFISENSTETDIIQELEKICEIFSSGTAQECKQVIDNFGPEIVSELINAVVSGETPKKVCTGLGLCQQKVLRKRQSSLCTPCEILLGILEVQLEKNTTEKDIERLIENVCNVLPATFADICKLIVEQELPSLIQMLENKEQPSKICAQLGLCKGKVPIKRQAKPLCDICQLVIQKLEDLIQTNSTEEDITKALEQVCNLFPASIKNQCDSFVQIYAKEIIELLISRADPKDICTKLALCSSEDRQPKIAGES